MVTQTGKRAPNNGFVQPYVNKLWKNCLSLCHPFYSVTELEPATRMWYGMLVLLSNTVCLLRTNQKKGSEREHMGFLSAWRLKRGAGSSLGVVQKGAGHFPYSDMTPVKQHISADEVQLAIRIGKRYASTSFFIRVLKTDAPTVSIGAVVSTKVASKATTRNYIKRTLRHAIREVLDAEADGYSIALIARKEIRGISFADLLKEVAAVLKQASVPTRIH